MKALDMIAKARMRGMRPAAVLIEVGTELQVDWWAGHAKTVTVALPDTAPLRDFDSRPLTGCDVIVVAVTADTDRVRAVVARVTQHAQNVSVLRLDGRELAGNVWARGSGWRAMQEAV